VWGGVRRTDNNNGGKDNDMAGKKIWREKRYGGNIER